MGSAEAERGCSNGSLIITAKRYNLHPVTCKKVWFLKENGSSRNRWAKNDQNTANLVEDN